MRTWNIGFGIEWTADHEPITDERARWKLREITKAAATQFGGFTLTPTIGGWKDEKTGIYHEETGRTLTICNDEHPATIDRFARFVADTLKQAAVVVTLVGDCNLVESTMRLHETTEQEYKPIYDGHG